MLRCLMIGHNKSRVCQDKWWGWDEMGRFSTKGSSEGARPAQLGMPHVPPSWCAFVQDKTWVVAGRSGLMPEDLVDLEWSPVRSILCS